MKWRALGSVALGSALAVGCGAGVLADEGEVFPASAVGELIVELTVEGLGVDGPALDAPAFCFSPAAGQPAQSSATMSSPRSRTHRAYLTRALILPPLPVGTSA